MLAMSQALTKSHMYTYHLFEIKISTGSTGKAKVKICSLWWNESISLNYDYSMNNILEIAHSYLESNGFKITGKSEGPKSSFLISTNFKHLK